MDWTSVNAKTTRTNDVLIDGDTSYGPSFSNFEGLVFTIDPSRSGSINLGTRKVIYSDINLWGFGTGSYQVTGSSNDEWFFLGGSPGTVILNGGLGRDSYTIGQWSSGTSKVYIKDYEPNSDIFYFNNYGSYSETGLAQLTSNLSFTHSGAGSTAVTKISLYTKQKDGVSEIYLSGHYASDGFEAGHDNWYQMYLKPTTSLNLGTVTLPTLTADSNSGSPSTGVSTYRISSNSTSVSEGSIAAFTLSTTGVASGTSLTYQITGVTAADIVGSYTTGSVTVDSTGKATINVPIASDNLTETDETLTVTIQGSSASMSVKDVSTQSNNSSGTTSATYILTAASSSVNEGSTAKLTLQSNAAAAGTTVAYLISGLSSEDLTSGEVSGRVKLDDLGMGTISIPIAADATTEGSEVMVVTTGGQVATITINDTSKSGSEYYISASDGLVNEGKVATFTVSAANAVAGTKLAYTISGSGITTKDIGNGKLSGSVSVGSDSSAIITVPIAADKTTEGDEELTLTLTGKGASETITIEDTSTEVAVAATYSLSAVDSSIEEGSEAEFLIETEPSEAGKQFKWTVTGLSAADVVGKKLSGTVVIDDDGTATISIPTATDALIEGNETLTLTVNGQKATVAVLDNNTVTIASVLLESDSSRSSAMYKLSDGMVVIAEAGLYDGDTLEDFVPLKASPSTNYAAPKTVAALISYSDGGYGLLSKTGVTYSEQKFSEDGIAKGKPTKLTASQLLAKETEIAVDLDDDGNIGDAIVAVLDEDGDASQEDSGLFQTLTGSLVVASTELGEGDAISDGLVLMASKTKGFTLKSTQTVLGLAQKESGHWEILIQSGKAISAQTFDAETGLMKGKAVTLKTAQVDAREYYYGIDLTGDGEVSIVGQETMPVGWLV